jgi:UDP-N-acetylglucosamine--N-acetylmuramyl-(pentapeptide) pyrophosphoryl-undecaprenol N-acetylglucosamine transferase
MAGGTGGHVFPALAVAEYLRAQGWHVSWLGTQQGLESRVVPAHDIAIDWLTVSGVRGKGLMSKLSAVSKLLRACWQAVRILRQRQPDVVLGMGGFVAAPGGFMAKLLGIPLIIHEQNRVVGTTNRLLARLANQVLEAFPHSFPLKAGAICTGNPLRQAFQTALVTPRIATQHFNIFVFGGSQGAQKLNENVPAGIALFARHQPTINVLVKHQTGTAMAERVTQHYQQLSVVAEVSAFIEDMVTAYQWADVVICRAGAMTISEVAAMGIPAIFIPLPSAIDDHQTANARYLTDAQAGILVQQADLTAEKLACQLRLIQADLTHMSVAARQAARLNATETVAQHCIRIASA